MSASLAVRECDVLMTGHIHGSAISVRRLSGHIGAEVGNVDLSAPLDDGIIAEIRSALLVHKVIFFRDQHIGHTEHVAFGRRFGLVTPAHPYEDETPDGFPEILTVDEELYAERYGMNSAQRRRSEVSHLSGWHTDLTPSGNPPMACILRAEVVPEVGGDTTWTNLAAAYEGLSGPLQKLADGLMAEHRYLTKYQGDDGKDGYRARVAKNVLAAVHPVVRVHPETGERILFVNPTFTSHVVGLSGAESRHLLNLFFEQITSPAYTVRFRWSNDAVAFWDNRCTAHLAPHDLGTGPVRRILYRISLEGDKPVGPGGNQSEIISGQPFVALA